MLTDTRCKQEDAVTGIGMGQEGPGSDPGPSSVTQGFGPPDPDSGSYGGCEQKPACRQAAAHSEVS